MLTKRISLLCMLLFCWSLYSYAQVDTGSVYISEFMASGNTILIDQDREFHDWIEIYNASDFPIDLSGWHVTDDPDNLDRWTFQSIIIQPKEYIIVFASGKDKQNVTDIHTNFSLSSGGEYLALIKPDGSIAHSYTEYPNQDQSRQTVSFGLNDLMQERFFLTPTPLGPNRDGIESFLNSPTFSHARGFYEEPFSLTLSSGPNTQIRFTTDGTIPTLENGITYNSPIAINTITFIRASVFQSGNAPSEPVTHSYFFLNDVIRQQSSSSLPSRWGNNVQADYEMDPDIVNHPDYADTIVNDLKTIPSVSIVMDQDDLFHRTRGIYVNPESKGINWERPSSTEWIYPDGRENFHINNGIRIQGGYSRVPDRKKHSFRLLFKNDYGPSKMQHNVFDHSTVNEFNTITLRGCYNYTWHGGEGGFGSNIGKAEYMRDEFARRTQLATGQTASHGTYVHVYLNGMYWGLYNVAERPDDAFSESYLGGNRDEYDVITGGTRGTNTTQIKSGNKDAWNQMMAIAQRGNFQLQENYESIQQYVDFDNLIDYMLVIFYTGNRDAPTVIGGGGTPWNFYTTRLRQPGAGLKSFVWDSEWCLEDLDTNVINFHRGFDNPALIFQQLRSNPDFLTLVADRIQKHFFNGGAMTAEASRARYTELKDMIDRAIVGESARWGDARGGSPKTRNDDWLSEVNRLLTSYFPNRTEVVLDQLRDTNLFPNIDAPQFNHSSGKVPAGFELTMTSESTVKETVELIGMTDEWRYNQSGDLGSLWKNTSFDDSNWESGKALLYVENSSLPESKNTPLNLGNLTYYFRKTFTLNPSIDLSQTTLLLETIIDDGAVIHINGRELFRIRMEDGLVRYQTTASQTVTNAALEGPFEFPGSLFRIGENTIAVEVHQTNSTSSDIVFGLRLNAQIRSNNNVVSLPVYYTNDGTDPRLPGGLINPKSSLFNQPIVIDENMHVRARAFGNNTWSAINEVSLFVGEQTGSVGEIANFLRVSELMYDPLGGGELEFIELFNSNPSTALRLDGLSFTQGIQYTFPTNTILPPGEYLVVTKAGSKADVQKFKNNYFLTDDINIVGPYTGQFANDGERVTLASNNDPVISFEYNDSRGWHIEADGAGHSLVPHESIVNEVDQSVLDYGGNWRPSYAIGGSPGKADPVTQLGVRINEFMAATASENQQSNDWIELYNPSTESVTVSQWYLSDDQDDLKKWAIPSTSIEALGFISFDEITGFHNPTDTGFGLNNDGEQIYLSYLPGPPWQDRVIDAVQFKAQEEGVSQSRFPDGSPYWYRANPTRNSPNQPLPYPLVIDEVLYAPLEDSNNPESSVLYEYIELWNQSNAPISLGDTENVYRIDGGISFTFQPGTVIQPNGRIVLVSFDPNDVNVKDQFLTNFEINDDINLTGPFEGRISNQGERLAIEKVRSFDELGEPVSWIVMDEVIYFSKTPWTLTPLENGISLQRLLPDESGNSPSNWVGHDPTPGLESEPVTSIHHWQLF